MNQTFTLKITLIAGLCLVLAWGLWVAGPQGSGATAIVDDHDAHLHMWNLWWVPHALTGLESPYQTTFIGFPSSTNLTYHQLILPLGVLSIPLHGLGWTAGQILVFWQYTGLVAGYIGMCLLIHRLGGSAPGMLAGSVFFLVNPLYWQNLARPDSLSYLLFPWILLLVIGANSSKRALLGSIFLTGIVLLMSPYHGVSLIVMWVLALPFVRTWNWNLSCFACIGPGALLWTAFHWFPQLIGDAPEPVGIGVIEAFSADLSAWLLPPAGLWWIGEGGAWWTRMWSATEPSLYPGWIVLALVVIGWPRIPARYRYPASLMTAVFFLISLGPSLRILGQSYFAGKLPYAWGLAISETFRAFRAPLRFAFPIFFLFSIGIGTLLPARRWIGWGITALIFIELLAMPVGVQPLPEAEPLHAVKQEVSQPALIGVPLTDWSTEVQYAQTIHEKKMPLLGRSYGTEALWDQIANQPVLNAFYRHQSLPEAEAPWERLKAEGYGGVMLHTIALGTNHSEILRRWKHQLRDRFGSPARSTNRWELYRFDQQ